MSSLAPIWSCRWYEFSHLKEMPYYYGDPSILNFSSSTSVEPSMPSDIGKCMSMPASTRLVARFSCFISRHIVPWIRSLRLLMPINFALTGCKPSLHCRSVF